MKAFLFDMNGTMINDMQYHEEAWHDILNNEIGHSITIQETKKHMYGKNEELFVRLFGTDKFTDEEVADWSMKKEIKYQERFRPHLKLINGLEAFLRKAKAQSIAMAIGTAANNFNVNYVLDNIDVKDFFASVIAAEDVATSKPNPEVFIRCADELGIPYADCVVFEDSPKGVEAAQNAGMKAVVLKTYHEEHEFAHLDNVLMFVDDYEDGELEGLF